jgi:hypothetical protein
MKLTTVVLSFASAATALVQREPAPVPKISNIQYWGSACPDGGLDAVIGAVDATTNVAPLSFKLANFLPVLGSFGSTLRMCNIVSNITVDKGWKVKVNARGTTAQGNADVPQNATMFLRSTYFFAEAAETQVSLFTIDVAGILKDHRVLGCST